MAIELGGVPIALVAVDTLLELLFVEERHDLSEDCFSLFIACEWRLDAYRIIIEVLIIIFELCK